MKGLCYSDCSMLASHKELGPDDSKKAEAFIKQLRGNLQHGATFPIKKLDEEIRKGDLVLARTRGNHKSAKLNAKFLADALSKETAKGWNLIIPDDKANQLPDLELAPLGVQEQIGVSASGDFVGKLCITHDLSFTGAISGELINSRVAKEQLEQCMFGHTLLRIVNTIVHFRQKFPTKHIWLRKEDFKFTYCQLHLQADTAFKSAVHLDLLACKD
jgi:hypothetical protein